MTSDLLAIYREEDLDQDDIVVNRVPSVGIHEGVPEHIYHNWSAVSKSGLSVFADNPGKYRYGIGKSSKVLTMGSAIDCLVFDGAERFLDEFAVKPQDYKGSRKEDKKWREENAHLQQLSHEEACKCVGAAATVIKYPLAQGYLETGKAQLSLVWEDNETGLLCKARPDFKPDGQSVLVDLKSTEDVVYEAIQRISHRFKYHWQAAFYIDGWKAITGESIEKFVFIFVEREPPYAVEVFRMDDDDIQLGRAEYRAALDLYVECKENNHWPLSSGVELNLGLPAYARR